MTNKILATILTISTLTSSITYAAKNIICTGLAKTERKDPVHPEITYINYIQFSDSPIISLPYPAGATPNLNHQSLTTFPNGEELFLSITLAHVKNSNFINVSHNYGSTDAKLPKNPDEFELEIKGNSINDDGFYKISCVSK